MNFYCLLVNSVTDICTKCTRNLLCHDFDNFIQAWVGLETEKIHGSLEQCFLPVVSWKSVLPTFPILSLPLF